MFESAGFGFTGSSGSGGGGVTGANNGLTLVGTTVNLGNSESGSAAVLTSDREIPMDGFELRFIGSEVDPGLGAKVFIGNGRIDIINNPDNIGNAILGFKDNSTGLSTTIEYDTNLLIAQDGQCNVIIGGATGNASLLQIRGSQFDFRISRQSLLQKQEVTRQVLLHLVQLLWLWSMVSRHCYYNLPVMLKYMVMF
jgi:hypothetical protein